MSPDEFNIQLDEILNNVPYAFIDMLRDEANEWDRTEQTLGLIRRLAKGIDKSMDNVIAELNRSLCPSSPLN